jgi:hypothetical protein
MLNCGRKSVRREAIWLLLTGSGLLGGCTTLSGYKPDLPESCVWAKVPHVWICVDPEEGKPVPDTETKLWGSYPLSMLEFVFEPPLQPVDLLILLKRDGEVNWREVIEENMNPRFVLKRWAMFGEP